MADYTLMKIDDMEAAYRGAFRKARSELGVTSFGMQVIDLPPNVTQYPEHDHAEGGQEEVYIVLRGRVNVEVDGDTIELDPDSMVRVGPAARRKITTGEEGARVLALGGVPGRAYDIVQFTEVGEPDPMARA